jgi:predicted O-methyltransferase YrrM
MMLYSVVSACVLMSLLACRSNKETPSSGNPTVVFREQIKEELPPGYSKPYAFSEDDWFSYNISSWQQLFASKAGKPGLHYLEIGVYEGRSFFWMLENVLTDPTSRLTAIDIFIPAEVERRFQDNVKLSGEGPRIATIKGSSQVELRKLPLESFDIIYVDGSHTADDVLKDAVLSWGLLKDGGIMVFDDFTWDGAYYAGADSHLPAELLPGPAISAFIQTHRNYLDVILSGRQIGIKKRENPCPNKTICSQLGDYTYDWQQKKLFRGKNHESVPLTTDEVRAMEKIFWNISYNGQFFVTQAVRETPEVSALLNRLGLKSRLFASSEQTANPGNPTE